MALDAQVGWLATITEPDGDYVEYHGEQSTQVYLSEFRETLKFVAYCRTVHQNDIDHHVLVTLDSA